MKPIFLSVFGLVSLLIAAQTAWAADGPENYATYAARVQIEDALISREGNVVLTHAVEDGDHMIRGWRLENGVGVQIGAFKPRRWGVGRFDKVFALSFDGQRIAQHFCEISKGKKKGVVGFVGKLIPGGENLAAGTLHCERVSLYDWSGEEVESNKYGDNDEIAAKWGPCGIGFGADNRLYVCSQTSAFEDRADFFDEINVFQPDLSYQTRLYLGYMPTSSGFMGRQRLQGLRVSDDGMEMLAWGYAYRSNWNSQNTDKHRGGQIWKLKLPAADCRGSRCLPRENITYIFHDNRPARQKNSEKNENARPDNALAVHSTIMQATAYDGGIIYKDRLTFDAADDLGRIHEEINGGDKKYDNADFQRAFRLADGKLFAGHDIWSPTKLLPVASRDGKLLFTPFGTGGRWLQSTNAESGRFVIVDEALDYFADDETVLQATFLGASTDVLVATNRRIARIMGPGAHFLAAAEPFRKSFELTEIGFAEAAIAELKKSFNTEPAAWTMGRFAPDFAEILRQEIVSFEPRYTAVQVGQLALAAVDLYTTAPGDARIGFSYPEGGTSVEPVVIGAIPDPNHPLAAIVQPGDRIVAVNTQPVFWRGDMRRVLDRHRAGETVQLTLRRGDAPITAETRLLPHTNAGAVVDMWARYSLAALQYGHPDLARAGAGRLREVVQRGKAAGEIGQDVAWERIADLIDVLVLGESQGADAAYQALLNQGGELKGIPASLVRGYARAARVLYADPKKLSYFLGEDVFNGSDFYKNFLMERVNHDIAPQPYVDLSGNIRQPGATAASATAVETAPVPPPPAPVEAANTAAKPSADESSDRPGGKVLD